MWGLGALSGIKGVDSENAKPFRSHNDKAHGPFIPALPPTRLCSILLAQPCPPIARDNLIRQWHQGYYVFEHICNNLGQDLSIPFTPFPSGSGMETLKNKPKLVLLMEA